jgi:hypothetical protein
LQAATQGFTEEVIDHRDSVVVNPGYLCRIRLWSDLHTERFENRLVVSNEVIVRFRNAGNGEALLQAMRTQDTSITSGTSVGRSGAVRLQSQEKDVATLLKEYAGRPDVPIC